jgi:hypothetical protein
MAQAFMQRRDQKKDQKQIDKVEAPVEREGSTSHRGAVEMHVGEGRETDHTTGSEEVSAPVSNSGRHAGGGAALQRIAALRGGLPAHRRGANPPPPQPKPSSEFYHSTSPPSSRSPSGGPPHHQPHFNRSRSGGGLGEQDSSDDHRGHHYAAYEKHVSSHHASRTGSIENSQSVGRTSFKSEGRASVSSAGFSVPTGAAVNFEDLPAAVKTRQEAGVFNDHAVPPVDETIPASGTEQPYPNNSAGYGEGGDDEDYQNPSKHHSPKVTGNRPKILRRGEGQRRILRAHQHARPAGDGGTAAVDPAVLGGPNVAPPATSGRPSGGGAARGDSKKTTSPLHEDDQDEEGAVPRTSRDEPRSPLDPHASTLRPEDQPIVARTVPTRGNVPSRPPVSSSTHPPPARRSKPVPAHLLRPKNSNHPSLRHAEGIDSHLGPVLQGAELDELDTSAVLGIFSRGTAGTGSVEGAVAAAERYLTQFLDSKRAEFLNAQLTYPLDKTNTVSKYVPRFTSSDAYFKVATSVGEFTQVSRILDSIGSH